MSVSGVTGSQVSAVAVTLTGASGRHGFGGPAWDVPASRHASRLAGMPARTSGNVPPRDDAVTRGDGADRHARHTILGSRRAPRQFFAAVGTPRPCERPEIGAIRPVP